MIKDKNALLTGSEPVKRYEWTKTNVFLIEKQASSLLDGCYSNLKPLKDDSRKRKTQNL